MAHADEELILRVLRGEKSLFGILVEKYEKAVYAVGYSYLRNVEDSRDLTQEVFIKAYDQLHSLKEPAKFGPWLSRIASRLSIDKLRVQKKDLPLPELGPVEDTLTHNPGQSRMTLEDREELMHRLRQIVDLIAKLPDYYRVAFILKYMEGLSNKEIAAFLDVPVSTVEGRLHKSREYLRKNMQQPY